MVVTRQTFYADTLANPRQFMSGDQSKLSRDLYGNPLRRLIAAKGTFNFRVPATGLGTDRGGTRRRGRSLHHALGAAYLDRADRRSARIRRTHAPILTMDATQWPNR
jgi:hypothetical protein